MTGGPGLLVTGGSGFLGTHVIPRAEAAGWRVVAPPSREMDVTDPAGVRRMLREAAPAAVVHLAYRRDDDGVIVEGSRIVAEAAQQVGARLVHLSTDVVFAGRAEAYAETDPPDPVHSYGRAKATAEQVVLRAAPGAVLVRTSLLFGTEHEGVCQRDVRLALVDPEHMAFFRDEIRNFTHAGDLADACVALAGRRDVIGPLHVCGSEPMDRYTFARCFARFVGTDETVLRDGRIEGSGLARPARVVLDTRRAVGLGLGCRPVSAVLGAA
ncbi:MAG: SDR family oxidoreductase [Thermoleophilia bacterium]